MCPSSANDPATTAAAQAARVVSSTKQLWAGWILTGLSGLFLLFDAFGKFAMPQPVVEAFVRLGFPAALGFRIGIILAFCTLVYLIPRSAVLGAVLLTGYLGGAIAIQMRAGSPLFENVFPLLFAILMWAGVYLRENRLSELLPIRR